MHFFTAVFKLIFFLSFKRKEIRRKYLFLNPKRKKEKRRKEKKRKGREAKRRRRRERAKGKDRQTDRQKH